jgi:hypothetical protein
MDEEAYQRAVRLIEDSRSIVDFAEYGRGVAPELIATAEDEIGSPLPDSYKWWLLHYGGGEIGGEEIFSVYPRDDVAILSGDIAQRYKVALADGGDRMLIPLCHSDVDGVFSFVIEEAAHGSEYHIRAAATGGCYADNFLDFIAKRIALFE